MNDLDAKANSNIPKKDKSESPPDISVLFEYRRKGYSMGDIAKLCDCSKSTVHKKLKKAGLLGLSDKALKHLSNNKADMFAWMQGRIVEAVTDNDIENATLVQKVSALGTLHEHERLERGKTTANLAIVDIVVEASEIINRHKQILDSIKEEMENRRMY